MALDAHVCCDCFERGRLRCPPPPGCNLSVDDDGGLLCATDDDDAWIAFANWQRDAACEHEDCNLVAHYIGNIALVAALRAELSKWPEQFSAILSRVIYNGIHGGDFIPAAEVAKLVPEVAALSEVHCVKPDMEQFMRRFESQMQELVDAALRVGKPLVF